MTERRGATRYPSNWVSYLPKTGEKGGPFQVINASEDGLFLAMAVLPKMGTTLIMEVVVGGKAMMVAGQVVRHIDAVPGAPMPGGVGLKLTTKPKNWTEIIKRLESEIPPGVTPHPCTKPGCNGVGKFVRSESFLDTPSIVRWRCSTCDRLFHTRHGPGGAPVHDQA